MLRIYGYSHTDGNTYRCIFYAKTWNYPNLQILVLIKCLYLIFLNWIGSLNKPCLVILLENHNKQADEFFSDCLATLHTVALRSLLKHKALHKEMWAPHDYQKAFSLSRLFFKYFIYIWAPENINNAAKSKKITK